MSSTTFKNLIQRREHKERSQPAHRSRFGLLEKHKDYVQRAKNYHDKEKRIIALKRRASMRNPDEFYFGMHKSKTEGGVHTKAREDVPQLTAEELELLKTQDRAYIQTIISAERKKIERLEASLHGLTAMTTRRGRGTLAMSSVRGPDSHHMKFGEDDESGEGHEGDDKDDDEDEDAADADGDSNSDGDDDDAPAAPRRSGSSSSSSGRKTGAADGTADDHDHDDDDDDDGPIDACLARASGAAASSAAAPSKFLTGSKRKLAAAATPASEAAAGSSSSSSAGAAKRRRPDDDDDEDDDDDDDDALSFDLGGSDDDDDEDGAGSKGKGGSAAGGATIAPAPKHIARATAALYRELELRRSRLSKLEKVLATMALKAVLAGKGTKQRVSKATKDAPAVYKWKQVRTK